MQNKKITCCGIMKKSFSKLNLFKPLALTIVFSALMPTLALAQEIESKPILLHAARVFDGDNFKTHTSVLISHGKILKIADSATFKETEAQVIDLGEATLLPGLIDLHTHLSFQHVPTATVLKHGITTARDVGGPIHQPTGGDGNLRVLSSGPILTAPNGYPIPNMGADNIAIPITSEKQARDTVDTLIEQGAVVIKVALEPGGEIGAPWSSEHKHGHGHQAEAEPTDHHHSSHHAPHAQSSWPLLSESIVKAIVDEAHKQGRKVTTHVAEIKGVTLALNAGIDEWAHLPCDAIPEPLLKQAVAQKVKIVGTLDTLAKCPGLAHNAHLLTALGAEFLYGAEIAHPDIPWGIDAQELMFMMTLTKMQPVDVLRTATAKAGQYLNIPLLGTLQTDAPADLIAVQGDPGHSFKILEYPDFVMSGGKIIVNNFQN
jgi:hypothetical protein